MLPIDICNEDLLTRFDSKSFEIHGEINYQKLKVEMKYLLVLIL